MHRHWLEVQPQDYDRNVRTDFLTGSVLPAQIYYKAQRIRELERREVLQALESVDILALVGSSEPAPLITAESGIFSKEEAIARMSGRRSLNGCFNLASVPAITIPCGFLMSTGTPMPIGLQLAGRPFSEELLLNVAYAYEQSTSWHTRRPPI